MNEIALNTINSGSTFNEDSYILQNLFFLPKGLPIQDHHIKLLRKWNINAIFTEGVLSTESMKKIVDTEDEKQEDSEIFSDHEAAPEELTLPRAEIIEKPSNNALLDNSVKDLYEKFKEWIKIEVNIFNEVIINKNTDKEKVKNLVTEITETTHKNKNNALMLFNAEFEGLFYVYPQTIKTVILSLIIGESLKLSQLAISNLAIATLFHDIGMLKIPKLILEKKEKLTPEEIKIIQNHTVIGYKYLRDIKYSAIIASGALQHHERMDGKGYPSGLSPDRITEIAKIISVTDAYCAAIASKPFKKSPLHAKEVIQDLLRGGGSIYEPSILKELIKNISFYPIGSLVLLSTDTPARVVGASGVVMKPIVKRLSDDNQGEIIDLSKRNEIYIKGLYSKKE